MPIQRFNTMIFYNNLASKKIQAPTRLTKPSNIGQIIVCLKANTLVE
jgi:hypothetical protein